MSESHGTIIFSLKEKLSHKLKSKPFWDLMIQGNPHDSKKSVEADFFAHKMIKKY